MTKKQAAIGIPFDTWSGRFFMALRPARKEHYPLYWEFPGGHVEAGEDAHECMIRELKEEIGIDVKQDEFLMHGKGPIFDLHVFLVTAWTGEIGIREDQLDSKWYTPDEGKCDQ